MKYKYGKVGIGMPVSIDDIAAVRTADKSGRNTELQKDRY